MALIAEWKLPFVARLMPYVESVFDPQKLYITIWPGDEILIARTHFSSHWAFVLSACRTPLVPNPYRFGDFYCGNRPDFTVGTRLPIANIRFHDTYSQSAANRDNDPTSFARATCSAAA